MPEGLTLLELDLIRFTAQFVARNGKNFLTGTAFNVHWRERRGLREGERGGGGGENALCVLPEGHAWHKHCHSCGPGEIVSLILCPEFIF